MGKRGNFTSGYYGRVGTFEDDENDFEGAYDQNCRKPTKSVLKEKVVHVLESAGDVVVQKATEAVAVVKDAHNKSKMPAPRRKTWFSLG